MKCLIYYNYYYLRFLSFKKADSQTVKHASENAGHGAFPGK